MQGHMGTTELHNQLPYDLHLTCTSYEGVAQAIESLTKRLLNDLDVSLVQLQSPAFCFKEENSGLRLQSMLSTEFNKKHQE